MRKFKARFALSQALPSVRRRRSRAEPGVRCATLGCALQRLRRTDGLGEVSRVHRVPCKGVRATFTENVAMGETPLEQQPSAAPARRASRLDSIDLLRGLIMVVMTLDHVRDYWHHDSLVARDP